MGGRVKGEGDQAGGFDVSRVGRERGGETYCLVFWGVV